MATELNVTELDDALLLGTTRQHSLLQSLLSAATSGAVVAFIASYLVEWLLCVFFALGGASLAFLYAKRKRTFELKVTKLKFTSSGKVGDNIGSIRTLSAADVQQLEFQEDTSGPETAYHLEGLYARVRHNSICLLPDVTHNKQRPSSSELRLSFRVFANCGREINLPSDNTSRHSASMIRIRSSQVGCAFRDTALGSLAGYRTGRWPAPSDLCRFRRGRETTRLRAC